MEYYKIIVGNTFIGAVRSGAFMAESSITHRLVMTTIEEAQFVTYSGVLYRDSWMRPLLDSQRTFISANIISITEIEYNAFIEAITNHEEIIIDDDDEPDEPVIIPEETEDPDIMLEYVREGKLNEMSKTCRTTIENGLDIEVHDEVQHFSLDTQDQLNLISLSALAQSQPEALIPYHADGELCVFYTAEEINSIVAAATEFKIYQTTYYNALKAYINSLDNIEDIAAVEYGMAIPDEFKSDVLKAIDE